MIKNEAHTTQKTTNWQQISLTLNAPQIYSLLASLSYGVFLDSGIDESKGKFDILSAEPESIQKIYTKDLQEEISINHFLKKTCSPTNTPPNSFARLPFVCGLMGFVSYEFGASLHIKNSQTLTTSNLPTLYIGKYTWSYVYHRKKKQGFLNFSPDCTPGLRSRILELIENSCDSEFKEAINKAHEQPFWQKTLSFSQYKRSFLRAKEYIKAGDCYQINLAQRLEANYKHSALPLYFVLREKVNTPYSAFFSFSDEKDKQSSSKTEELLCFSPEQFIGIENRQIDSKPVKGTLANTVNDSNGRILVESEKNRVENVMIVDLLRNDLSKVCKLNSVKVSKLFDLETFKNVHHLVSHIKGVLIDGVDELSAFFSCFPGGSITGAPKKRAMEIINELENGGRDAYCGSIFYLNVDGKFDSNILIRSIVHSRDKLYCWGGGGIVDDSTLEEEYLESLIKVSNLTGIVK